MEVVRLPIAFNGLGRSLVLHEDASDEPYTLTIPDFDLFTESTQKAQSTRNSHLGGPNKTKRPCPWNE